MASELLHLPKYSHAVPAAIQLVEYATAAADAIAAAAKDMPVVTAAAQMRSCS